MSEDMIERVALAMWQAREESHQPRLRRMTPDALDMASGAWALMLEQARVAIEAMRIPSEHMTDQIMLSDIDMDGGMSLYVAMIDAALDRSEPEQSAA